MRCWKKINRKELGELRKSEEGGERKKWENKNRR